MRTLISSLSCAALLGCNPSESAPREQPPVVDTPEPRAKVEPAPKAESEPPPSLPAPVLPPFASARLHHDGPVVDIAWSADGARLASCSDDGALRVWDANTHALVHTFTSWPTPPRHAALSRDAGTIIGHAAHEVRVFDGSAGTLRHTLQHHAPTTAVALTPDGATVISAADDGVRSWTDGSETHHLEQRGAHPLSLAIIDDREVLSGWSDGKVRRIDVARGRFVGKAIAVDSKLERLDHDGGRFMIAGADGRVQVWQLSPAKLMTRGAELTPLALGMNGNLLLVTSAPRPEGPTISVADVYSGTIAREFLGHDAPVLAAVFSPDGARFASADADGDLLIWAAP